MAKEDNWVNIVKLLSIFTVLLGHYNYYDNLEFGHFLTHIVKGGVCVMFIYNGYYLYKNKTLDSHDKTIGYLSRLAVMAGVWITLYFLKDIWYGEKTAAAVYGAFCSLLENAARFNNGVLWYVQNLFLAVALLFVFKKKRFRMWEFVMLALLLRCYYWLLLFALLGIGIGYVLAEHEDRLGKKALLASLSGAVLSVVVLWAVIYGKLSTGTWLDLMVADLGKYTLAASMATAGICMDKVLPLALGKNGRYLRKISTVIYLSHLLFTEITFRVAAALGAQWGTVKFFVYSAGTAAVLSVITGIVLIAASGWKPLKFLKRIY